LIVKIFHNLPFDNRLNFNCKNTVFGAFLAHYFTDLYGRRTTFVVAAIGFILGLGIMVFSSTYSFLLVGRTFVGLGVGIGFLQVYMY
jgi:predicted MFS family arabinose efflux permease